MDDRDVKDVKDVKDVSPLDVAMLPAFRAGTDFPELEVVETPISKLLSA